MKKAKILWTITEPCLANFRGESREITIQNVRISSWSYDMAGHAKMCGTIL